jgi:NAD(P)-dependent dehydrogenase (short-subunit alcohol dehydrogenase family)
MRDVEGKVAFITGGASGIGLGTAKAFVNAGMKVMITDVRQDRLDQALDGFKQQGKGENVSALRLDVTDRDAFARVADETEMRFGKIHVLCNNAGIGIIGPIKAAKYGDWDWGMSVMLGGVVNGIQTMLPRILRHGEGGHIVSTSSMAGVLPVSRASIYCAVKGAVVAMCEALRGELAADNIGVSAFCPGPVSTNIREAGQYRPEQYRKDSGYVELEANLAQREDPPEWMSIEECGERVLRGIQRNDLFIFTHPEFKAGVAERMNAMLACFPDEPVNQALAEKIGFLTSNAIYKETIEAAGKK